jgi:hypothetical protein
MILEIIGVVLIISYMIWLHKRKRLISPATNLTITYKGRIDNMEKYTLDWVPAKKPFAETQQVFAAIDGAVPAQIGADLEPQINTVDVVLKTGATVSIFVRTIGDNESIADSAPINFTADNQDKIDAATGLSAKWVEHVPD